MTLLLLGSALAGVLALSWLHLRKAGVRQATAVPSLQHLQGTSPRRWRALPLEEPLAWALRAAALLLALSGTWASRSGCGAEKETVALVDANAPEEAWERALSLAPTVLGFRGEAPVAGGEGAGLLQTALGACSDTQAACLLRAANLSRRPLLLVGAFAAAEWRVALAQRARAFSFLRTGRAAPPSAEAPLPSGPRAQVLLQGTSSAARVWAAALATAAEETASVAQRPAPPVPVPEVVVVDARTPRPAPNGGALTFLAVDGPGPAQPDAPAAKQQPGVGLVLPDPLDVAAGTAGLGLNTTLAFAQDGRFQPVLPLAARLKGADELALAATAEELGSWAHQGSLLPLTRALLSAALPGPTVVGRAPAGGGLGWTDAEGRLSPVGLLDVHPGPYLRADGRVALQLPRAQVPGEDALDEAALAHLGGRPWQNPGRAPPNPPALLFSLALLFWLLGAFLTRRRRQAWLPAAAVAVGLALLVADVRWASEATANWAAVLAVSPGPAARALVSLAQQTAVTPLEGGQATPPACATLGAEAPCTPLGTLGWAAAPRAGMDGLLFDTTRPRVDVLSVEAPREVALGTAAEVWTTLRVRRAQGRRVTLSVRCTSAAPTSVDVPVEGPDMVRTVRLVVSPLQEGLAFLSVEARVADEAQAEDGRLLALAARTRAERRLVLAAAPAWEARAAAAALQRAGVKVDTLTLLGTRAVVARGRTARTPRDVLQEAGALEGVGLLAVVGFGLRELDAGAMAGLRHYVASGGAALVLDAPGVAAALGVEVPAVAATAPLQPLVGQLGPLAGLSFRGYAPPSAFQIPAGVAVLGRLGPASQREPLPWVVGRAVGQGRVAVVTAPDVWRLSPPGEGRAAYQQVLAHLVGWLEAPRASRHGLLLSETWDTLRLEREDGERLIPLAAAGTVDGLPVDALDVASFNHSPRAALRAKAAAAHHPFLELEGTEALASAWGRLPPPPRWRTHLKLRASQTAFAVLVALLVLEALARRRYGGSGASGRRASSAASEAETGGMTSAEGLSQRASETPASRAAARRAGASPAA